jgi:hypothetical protein
MLRRQPRRDVSGARRSLDDRFHTLQTYITQRWLSLRGGNMDNMLGWSRRSVLAAGPMQALQVRSFEPSRPSGTATCGRLRQTGHRSGYSGAKEQCETGPARMSPHVLREQLFRGMGARPSHHNVLQGIRHSEGRTHCRQAVKRKFLLSRRRGLAKSDPTGRDLSTVWQEEGVDIGAEPIDAYLRACIEPSLRPSLAPASSSAKGACSSAARTGSKFRASACARLRRAESSLLSTPT